MSTVTAVTYTDVRDYVKPFVDTAYSGPRKVTFAPGPSNDTQAQKLSPGRIVFLDVGGGPGETTEGLFDRVFIGLRVVGPQHSYEAAEEVALFVDRVLTSFDHTADIVPGKRCTGIIRSGGRPQLLTRDSGERYHFTASYIAEFETGI